VPSPPAPLRSGLIFYLVRSPASKIRHPIPVAALTARTDFQAAGATSGGFYTQLAHHPFPYPSVPHFVIHFRHMSIKTINWKQLLAFLWVLLFPFSVLLMLIIMAISDDGGGIFTKLGPGDLLIGYIIMLPLSLLIAIIASFRTAHTSKLLFLPVPLVIILLWLAYHEIHILMTNNVIIYMQKAPMAKS
jgi:hypothetical protein